jgi:hypothetical protein
MCYSLYVFTYNTILLIVQLLDPIWPLTLTHTFIKSEARVIDSYYTRFSLILSSFVLNSLLFTL